MMSSLKRVTKKKSKKIVQTETIKIKFMEMRDMTLMMITTSIMGKNMEMTSPPTNKTKTIINKLQNPHFLNRTTKRKGMTF